MGDPSEQGRQMRVNSSENWQDEAEGLARCNRDFSQVSPVVEEAAVVLCRQKGRPLDSRQGDHISNVLVLHVASRWGPGLG